MTCTPARVRVTNAVLERPVRGQLAAALDLVARLALRVSTAARATAERLLDVPPGLIADAHAEKARRDGVVESGQAHK